MFLFRKWKTVLMSDKTKLDQEDEALMSQHGSFNYFSNIREEYIELRRKSYHRDSAGVFEKLSLKLEEQKFKTAERKQNNACVKMSRDQQKNFYLLYSRLNNAIKNNKSDFYILDLFVRFNKISLSSHGGLSQINSYCSQEYYNDNLPKNIDLVVKCASDIENITDIFSIIYGNFYLSEKIGFFTEQILKFDVFGKEVFCSHTRDKKIKRKIKKYKNKEDDPNYSSWINDKSRYEVSFDLVPEEWVFLHKGTKRPIGISETPFVV